MLPLKIILHPTDFSESSGDAFQLACSLARDQGARLVILHVVPGPAPAVPTGDAVTLARAECMERELTVYREEMRDKLQRLPVPYLAGRVSRVFKEGDAATEILRVAEEMPCDLIVMGSHGWPGEVRRLMGSVAEEVTRRAPCPVLALRGCLPQPRPSEAPARQEVDVIL
jgi:nucleotide-binding universal stress UspA family protein